MNIHGIGKRVAAGAADGLSAAGHRHDPKQLSDEAINVAAGKLGTNVEDLKSSLESGQKLQDIAKEKGVSFGSIRSSIEAAEGHGKHQGQQVERDRQTHDKSKLAETLATNLGVKASDLLEALESGSSLGNFLQSSGISAEQFQAAVAKALGKDQTASPTGTVVNTTA